METKITFYPIGNADTTLIALANNQKVLFDYANMRCADDPADKRIDLPKELNKVVTGDSYDVVCFTHMDNDHICGFSEYFHLEHAKAYQGEGRKKIKEMWVPAAILLETSLDGEALTLRTEARFRLRNKTGIRIFSRPKKLKQWCDQQLDICFDDIKHLIVDAGTLVPDFTKQGNGVEFFVHSPFASETQQIDRNNEAIVVQATFGDACETKLLLGSDLNSDAWSDIVKITRHFGRDERLRWNIFHLSHHCSYTALNWEKGETETKPTPEVKWLFENQGENRCWIISPSWCIPTADTTQPPHKQAAAYYRKVANSKAGGFKVTMDHPTSGNPKPMTFVIDSLSCARLQIQASAAFASFEQKPSRAGHGQ
ncbi:hypothetical protein HRH25_21985 [Flavisolibacter sp. BT320]|nr:hypothetical protein [Flavisolibacter longurius]